MRIEYIRKNDGFRKVEGSDSDEKRMVTRGEKKGVLYCGIDPNDAENVVMGYSLCSPLDRFDYIGGDRHEKGFGVNTAKERAEKWSLHDNYFVQNSFTERMIYEGQDLLLLINPDPQQIVEIPPSIMPRLKTFIERCRRYYKDKEFPAWVKKIEAKLPTVVKESRNVTECFNLYREEDI